VGHKGEALRQFRRAGEARERRASGYNVGKLMTPAPPISISKIIDLATGPKAAFYSLIAAIFLSPFVFVPDGWWWAPELAHFSCEYRVWMVVLFWLSVSVLLASLIQWFAIYATGDYRAFLKRRRIWRYLVRMPHDQLNIAMQYARDRRVSLPFGEHSGAIRDLERRGIVYQAGTVLSPRGTYPFVIHDDAQEFFTEHGFQKVLDERTRLEMKRRGRR
jgi:hypothetical protein